MLNTFKAMAGALMALFCLTFLRMMARHLAHLGAPHQGERLAVDGALATTCGYVAYVLLAGAFRARPAMERVEADGTLTVGTTLARRLGERLVVQATPKSRLSNTGIFGFWGLTLLLGLPTLLHRHAWGWLTFNAILSGFSLLMLGYTLAHWRDSCVWDRAQGMFQRNGTPVRPLSEIAGIEIGKSGGVYSLWFVSADGTKDKVAPTLGGFRNEAEAERLAQEIRDFLALAPAGVWPPPPASRPLTQPR